MSETHSKDFQRELAELAPAPRRDEPAPSLLTFNIEYGMLEAHLRGT